MVTNTSRWLTCFSDLALEPEAAIFPSNKEILAYLKRYARRFDIVSQVHFCTRVELIENNPQGVGWLVRSNGAEEKSEIFPYVIVASGRFNKPLIPPLPGLDSFCGHCGVLPDHLHDIEARIAAEAASRRFSRSESMPFGSIVPSQGPY